ncbi:hypothetical protein [Streptomyces ovatisporus]|uniref:hypothetical protein n=1 Tax=Streptomyces ovatisporus TaxID=1128682 RepID=UPI0036DB306F
MSDTKRFPAPTTAGQPTRAESSPQAPLSSEPEQAAHARQPEQGALIPESPALSKMSYSAPLSYVGITRRISARIKRVGAAGPFAAWLAWALGAIVILLGWALVTVWYAITLLLFNVFLFPYRLIRRSHRKQEQLQQAELATMQAMMINQQRTLNERKPPQ